MKRVSDVPHMIKMWDFKLNTDDPSMVSAHLREPRHWKCNICGYSWTASVKARYRSSGKCPCHESNKIIMKGVNDVLTVVKGLLELLDESNDWAKLYSQGIDSSMPVNMYCKECGRKWAVVLKAQIRKDGKGGYRAVGCPHYNTIKRKEQEVPFCNEVEAIYRFWDDNNPVDPYKTKSNSNEKVHFVCKQCGYDWNAEIRSQARGTGKCKCCELQMISRKGYTDVFTLIPESQKFFNFKKNKDIDIYSIPLRNSDIFIDWKCPDCGYEWSSPLTNRIIGKKGAYSFRLPNHCASHNTSLITSVASKPKLVKYWDFKKNKGIDINLTSAHSCEQVYWRDKKCGYEWKESIQNFNGRDDECPFCAGKYNAIMLGKNDIFTLFPDLSSIYDFETNERKGIDICSITPNSTVEAHFACKKCGYEWDSPIANRLKYRNGKHVFVDCPKCSNKKHRQIPYSEEYPDLAVMYRRDLNSIDLDSIRGAEAINHTYRYWDCPVCGETFESTLSAMTQSVRNITKGCPYCSHTKLREGESFADIHPELIEEYDPSNEINIFEVFPNCKTTAKWICKDCGLHWNATFALRHTGAGKCPECYKVGRNIKEECFAAVYPEFVDLWSSDNEHTPYDTFYTSNLWIRWNCQVCGNVYGSEIQDIISGDAECPYCNDRLVLPGVNSLKTVKPELAKLISPLNEKDADHILPSKRSIQLWRCPVCSGDYNAFTLEMENGYTCPYCNDRLVLPGFNSLKAKNPELAKLLSPLNEKDADHILPSKQSPQLWRCPDCNGDYNATTYEMENGYTCPYCDDRLVLPGVNSLKALNPELAKLLSPLNEKDADHILPAKQSPQLWRCPDCDGDYNATTYEMENGYTCPFCNDRLVLPGVNSLKVKNPELAKLLSPLNEKDSDHILPSKQSPQLWRCPDCGGDYNATTFEMENGYTCPYCNNRQLLKGFNSFGDRHPVLVKELDEIANYLLPYTEYDVLDTSNKKFWWACSKNPKHKYPMSPSTRLMFQKRHREPCLYCRGQRRKLNHFIEYKS